MERKGKFQGFEIVTPPILGVSVWRLFFEGKRTEELKGKFQRIWKVTQILEGRLHFQIIWK
jgi:hypothetical protein